VHGKRNLITVGEQGIYDCIRIPLGRIILKDGDSRILDKTLMLRIGGEVVVRRLVC
jgi:hypothetical protein